MARSMINIYAIDYQSRLNSNGESIETQNQNSNNSLISLKSIKYFNNMNENGGKLLIDGGCDTSLAGNCPMLR